MRNLQILLRRGWRQRTLPDYTVKVDATGLQPDRRYFYRFLADGLSSSIGRTRTLPRGEVAAFRLGVASCSNYPQGYFNAYRHMAESDLDLILHLGDYIYEYPEGATLTLWRYKSWVVTSNPWGRP